MGRIIENFERGPAWTAERKALLKQRWEAGASATEIANELGGVTRNAVMGVLHRMKLLGTRSKPSLPTRAQGSAVVKPAPKVTRKPLALAGNGAVFEKAPPSLVRARMNSANPAPEAPLPKGPSRAFKPLPGVTPVTIMGLGAHTCRWPVELDGETEAHFCAALPTSGIYCRSHAVMAAPRAGAKEHLDHKLGIPAQAKRAAA